MEEVKQSKSPENAAIIPNKESNNNTNNVNNNINHTPPTSPTSPASPESPTSPSSSSSSSRSHINPLLVRSLTKTFPNNNNNNNGKVEEEERKLQKKASFFEFISPFNNSTRRTRTLNKSASSPDLGAVFRSKKDCSIVIKVFEARNLPEARQRKKREEKNINTLRRAKKMVLEVTSPNLMSFSDATDPYCAVQVEKVKMRTRTIEKKLNPFWCEEFTFEVLDSSKSKVVLTVIDEKKYAQQGGDVIGKVVIPINALRDQREKEQWFPIQPSSSSNRIPQIHMHIAYTAGSADTKPSFNFQILGGRNLGLGTGGTMPQVEITFKLKDSSIKVHSWLWTDIHALSTLIELAAPLETFTILLWKKNQDSESNNSPRSSKEKKEKKEKGEKERIVLGQVSIPVVDLNEERDYWFCLFGKESGYGDLRVKLKYNEEVVLRMDQYQEFLELLQEEDLKVIRTLAAVAKPNTREGIAYNLVRVFEACHLSVFLLDSLNSDEIESTPNPDIIFRGNSLATKSVDQYMKLVGGSYMNHVLKALIKKFYLSQKGCEVDPSKLEKGEDLKQNWKNLIAWVTQFTDSIFGSLDVCPKTFREVFRGIRQKCIARFPDDVAKFTAVSGFIFLRFFCPAILAPKLFKLAPDHPDLKQARHLILVAKTLQNLANLVEFGTVKEEFMKNMNEFVVANLDNMKKFINDIATVPENAPAGEAEVIYLEKELASMYRHLLKHKEDMIQYHLERNDEAGLRAMDRVNTILEKIQKDVRDANSSKD